MSPSPCASVASSANCVSLDPGQLNDIRIGVEGVWFAAGMLLGVAFLVVFLFIFVRGIVR